MASVLTFLRPLRQSSIQRILLVQSGPFDLMLNVLNHLRATYEGCAVKGVVCEEDRELLKGDELEQVAIVRWEERFEVLKKLRKSHYDAVVVLYSHLGSYNLKLLPVLLRTRHIIIYNDNVDYFPLNIWRLPSFSLQVSGSSSILHFGFWAFRRLCLTPVVFAYLLASTACLYLRVTGRRFRQAVRRGRPN